MNAFYIQGSVAMLGVFFWVIMIGAVACNSSNTAELITKKVCTYSVWRGDTGVVTCRSISIQGSGVASLEECDGGVLRIKNATNVIERCQ
jgi:hypothetical protein